MLRISRSRPNSWYRSWMVADRENAEERDAKRREVAKELREAVETQRYDSQTLEEIIQVLDHEILCLRPEVNELEDAIREYQSGEDLQLRDLSALSTPSIDHFLTTLSDCLVRSINKSSHYERELQSRSLISALTLLRAHRVESRQTDHYDLLRSRFEERFRDLQWQRKLSGPFTREKFRHFQCSYLLSAGAEYAKIFERARPHMVSVVSRAVDVALLGVSITLASQATHGFGIDRLALVLRDFDRALTPLWLSPNEQYQDLFEVQDLTRILTAFHFYCRVISQDSASPSPILDCSQDFAKTILGRILQLLDQRPDFERTDRPTPAIWDQILAFFGRGPPDFNRYFYIYGLLDCATQVAKTVPLTSVGRDFTSRMRLIIQSSKEPSYRWKAIEFLLCDPKARNEEAQKISNSCKQSQPMINLEKEAILECLYEEEGVVPLRRDRRNSELPSSDSTLSVPLPPRLTPGGWIENSFSTPNLSPEEESFNFAIRPRGRFNFSPEYQSVALSPDCKAAIFVAKSLVRIFSLQNPNTNPILERKPTSPMSFYKVAVASNRFLAVITDDHLNVYVYGSSIPEGVDVGTEAFSSDPSEWSWGPNCVAIHETEERTWIAVGGCGNRRGQEYGSIRMYRVDATAGCFTLTAQSANFARQDCFTPEDPLSNDFLKMINFSSDGGRLVAVTIYNRVLVWFLSNNRRPRHAPFKIEKSYTTETEAHGMLSATIFHSPSSRPYVLCTTSPSDQRWRHGGEWSFISAVADSPACVPAMLQFDFCALGKREKGIVTGAISPDGKVVALLNQKGKIKLFTLKGNIDGGLYSALEEPLILKEKLTGRKSASSDCLRFLSQNGGLSLFAIDLAGKVIRAKISGNE